MMAASVPLANAPIYYVMVPANGDSVHTVSPVAGLSLTSNPVVARIGGSHCLCHHGSARHQRHRTGVAYRRAVAAHGQGARAFEPPQQCPEPGSVLGKGTTADGHHAGLAESRACRSSRTENAREHWLTRGASIDRQPTFSPDGKRVLFSSNRSGNLDVWENGRGNRRALAHHRSSGNDWDPSYTPDGRSILWSSDRGGTFEIWKRPPDGTARSQISHDGVDAENPTMTPDGQWILFLSGRPELAVRARCTRTVRAWRSLVKGVEPARGCR
jgi:hypothetical protein